MKKYFSIILFGLIFIVSERCASEDNKSEPTTIQGIVLDAETLNLLTHGKVIIKLFDNELTPPFVYSNLIQDTVEIDGIGEYKYVVQEGNERIFYRTEVLRPGYTWSRISADDPWAKGLEAGENGDYVYGAKCGYAKINLTNDIAITSNEIRIGTYYEEFRFLSQDTTVVMTFDYRFKASFVLELYSSGQLIKSDEYNFSPVWSDTVKYAASY